MMNYYPLLLSSFRPSPSVSSGGDKIPLEEELVGGEPPPPGNRVSGTAAAAGLPSSKDDQSVASESSGFGSLPKKRSGTYTATTGEVVIGLGLVDDRVTDCDPMVESGGGGAVDAVAQSGVSPTNPMLSSTDHGHSRNSSNTSQVSDIKVTGVEVEV